MVILSLRFASHWGHVSDLRRQAFSPPHLIRKSDLRLTRTSPYNGWVQRSNVGKESPSREHRGLTDRRRGGTTKFSEWRKQRRLIKRPFAKER
jgi:hypothetical protein